MKRSHKQQRELAVFAFGVTVVLALAIFYILWSGAFFGRTIEGTRSLACVQWQQENPGQACPDFVIKQPELQMCCCQLIGGTSEFSQYQINIQVFEGANEQERAATCNDACAEGNGLLMGMGRCDW